MDWPWIQFSIGSCNNTPPQISIKTEFSREEGKKIEKKNNFKSVQLFL